MQDDLAGYYIGIVPFGIDSPAISTGRLSKLEYFSIVHIASADFNIVLCNKSPQTPGQKYE